MRVQFFARHMVAVSHFTRCRPARCGVPSARLFPSRNVLHPLMRGHVTNMAAVHSNKHITAAQRRITCNDYPPGATRPMVDIGPRLRSGSSARARELFAPTVCSPFFTRSFVFVVCLDGLPSPMANRPESN